MLAALGWRMAINVVTRIIGCNINMQRLKCLRDSPYKYFKETNVNILLPIVFSMMV